jgi:hypothetical protein
MSANTETMTPEEIRLRGLEALSRELGPAGLIRFLQQFEIGRGDYSRERHSLLADCTLDEILHELKQRQPE